MYVHLFVTAWLAETLLSKLNDIFWDFFILFILFFFYRKKLLSG